MLANSGQMWFYHAPSKRVDKPQEFAPAASQIPGLATLDPLDQEAWEREVGVKKQAKESDSNYIRLAKQGGRKNLLAFPDPKSLSDDAKPYPRVDWFDHQTSDPEKDEKILSQTMWQPPDYMVHDYAVSQTDSGDKSEIYDGAPKPKRAPFYTDNMSVWARPNVENKPKRNRRRKAGGKVEKLPEIAANKTKKSQPVAFSKLIGGEYGREWYQKQATQVPIKPKHTELNQGKGYLNMTEYQQNICRKVILPKKLKPISIPQAKTKRDTEDAKEKPLFKLSKFSKVESKLKTEAN